MSSILSAATTLVNPKPTSSSSSSSAHQIHSTFLGSYAKLQPDVKLLNSNGYPAENTSKGLLSFAQNSKEIKVDIPAIAFRITSMSNSTKSPPNLAKATPEGTLFSANEHRLVDIRNRGHLSKLVEMLIGRRCEKPRFCFSEDVVKSRPKESSKMDLRLKVSVEYQYSTTNIISSNQDGTKLSEAEKDRLLDKILGHLDTRGILWTHAGRLTNDKAKENDSDETEEERANGLKFLVLGAFPKVSLVCHPSGATICFSILPSSFSSLPVLDLFASIFLPIHSFISRSNSFNPPGSSLSDPLPSDLSHPQDSDLIPLVLDASLISDSSYLGLSVSSSSTGTGKGERVRNSDPLEGCRLSFTREPFRGGAKGFDTPRGSGMGSSATAFSGGVMS